MIQGSRWAPGGRAVNTPAIRAFAVRRIHVPIVSWLAGFPYTDTTNGFRGYSRSYLLDPRVQPFRDVFDRYELLAYLSVRGPRLGFRTTEIPVTRAYPQRGAIPTRIDPIRGNFDLLATLWRLARGRFHPST